MNEKFIIFIDGKNGKIKTKDITFNIGYEVQIMNKLCDLVPSFSGLLYLKLIYNLLMKN